MRKGLCVTLFVGTAVLTLSGVYPLLAAEKVKIGTPLKFQAVFAMPMLAAEEKGFWKQQGLEVEWVPFTGEVPMQQAVATGILQLAITDVTGAISGMSRGLPIVIVSHMGPVTDYALWVKSGSAIKEPGQLKGKTVDVLRFGDVSHAYGMMVVKALGLEGQIRFVATGSSEAGMAAVKSGVVDSTMKTYFAIGSLWVAGEVHPVLELADYLPKQWLGRVVEVRRDFLGRNPEAVGRAVNAVLQATDFVMKNRSWTLEKMKSFSRYSQEAAEFLFPKLTYSKDGRIDKKALANVREFLTTYGIAPAEKTPLVEELYTPQFTG